MKNLLIIVALLFGLSTISEAQVGKAKENARKSKSGSSSGSSDGESWSSSGGGGDVGADIAFFLFEITFRGVGLIQMNMLDRKEDEPWIVSLDGSLTAAADPNFGTVSFTPTVRGTWGLFSTQLRTNRLFDGTGTLQTIDWQVIQLNILSQEYVGLRYGVGLSQEITEDISHFEQYLGLQLHFKERMVNPELNVRWSDDGGARLEINALVDWKFQSRKKLDIGVISGYSFQRWYGVPFHMIQTGLSFRIE